MHFLTRSKLLFSADAYLCKCRPFFSLRQEALLIDAEIYKGSFDQRRRNAEGSSTYEQITENLVDLHIFPLRQITIHG